jgi:predicted nuclease of predicted toxin-antitoxin system
VKLLIDQNLSPALADQLTDLFPGSVHVQTLGKGEDSDTQLWNYAKANGYLITTKDTGFHQRCMMYGFPPKVIWVKSGNCSTGVVINLLRKHFPVIQQFHDDHETAFLELY